VISIHCVNDLKKRLPLPSQIIAGSLADATRCTDLPFPTSSPWKGITVSLAPFTHTDPSLFHPRLPSLASDDTGSPVWHRIFPEERGAIGRMPQTKTMACRMADVFPTII
jgi:hypothetical protein